MAGCILVFKQNKEISVNVSSLLYRHKIDINLSILCIVASFSQ